MHTCINDKIGVWAKILWLQVFEGKFKVFIGRYSFKL